MVVVRRVRRGIGIFGIERGHDDNDNRHPFRLADIETVGTRLVAVRQRSDERAGIERVPESSDERDMVFRGRDMDRADAFVLRNPVVHNHRGHTLRPSAFQDDGIGVFPVRQRDKIAQIHADETLTCNRQLWNP